MRFFSVLIVAALLPVLGACDGVPPAQAGKKDQDASTQRDDGHTKKRKPTSTSSQCLHLVGGTATAQFPATTMILAKTGPTRYEFCSASFIGPNTLITAGHCLDAIDPMNLRLAGSVELPTSEFANRYNAGLGPSSVITNGAAYIGQSIDTNNDAVRQRDLAVVIFAKTVAPAVFAVAAARPTVGDVVTMASYGATTFMATSFAKGFQQTGSNVIDNYSSFSALIATTSQASTNTNPQDVLASSGDSGGPLLKGGLLAGVLSMQGLLTSPTTIPLNLWVDLNSAESKNLLARAVAAGAIIGPLPPPATPEPPKPATDVSPEGGSGEARVEAETSDVAKGDDAEDHGDVEGKDDQDVDDDACE